MANTTSESELTANDQKLVDAKQVGKALLQIKI